MSYTDESPVTVKSGQLATGYVAERLEAEREFPELVPEHGSGWMDELENAIIDGWYDDYDAEVALPW